MLLPVANIAVSVLLLGLPVHPGVLVGRVRVTQLTWSGAAGERIVGRRRHSRHAAFATVLGQVQDGPPLSGPVPVDEPVGAERMSGRGF